MTPGLMILLTNTSTTTLTLVSSQVIGSSNPAPFILPKALMQATYGGLGTEVSTTPYKALWSYSPDGGKTLLAFECDLSGPRGLTIVPTKTGPAAGQWTLGEEPHLAPEGGWLVRFWYGRPG